MRKPVVLTLAFIVSMMLGTVPLLLITVGIGFIRVAIQQRNHSGIGAVAGGISEAMLLLVPLLCGIIGVLITLRRLDQRKS